MRKRKKAKATASDATEPGLASQSATLAIDSPSPASSSGEAVTASDAMPPPALPSETLKVGAPSDVPRTSQQSSAIRQVDMTLGQIVTIFMRSPQHKQRPWPILSGSFCPPSSADNTASLKRSSQASQCPLG
jgi:hypothetical protein